MTQVRGKESGAAVVAGRDIGRQRRGWPGEEEEMVASRKKENRNGYGRGCSCLKRELTAATLLKRKKYGSFGF